MSNAHWASMSTLCILGPNIPKGTSVAAPLDKFCDWVRFFVTTKDSSGTMRPIWSTQWHITFQHIEHKSPEYSRTIMKVFRRSVLYSVRRKFQRFMTIDLAFYVLYENLTLIRTIVKIVNCSRSFSAFVGIIENT